MDPFAPKPFDEYKKRGLKFVKVLNDVGFEVTFCNLGASIFSIKYLNKKMTYGPLFVKDFLKKNVYHGKTIGRVAGRIKEGKILVNDKTIQVAINEGPNTLHGGKGGISERIFTCEVYRKPDRTEIVYSYYSQDLEAGFPGSASIETRYIVPKDKAELRVEFTCRVSEKCPISLTNHSYFCLGDSNINNLKLQIASSNRLEMDPRNLLLGGPIPVPSYLDFRKSKLLVEDIANKEMHQGMLSGYDHFLMLDEGSKSPQITLENDNFKLDISTDLDGVVIYSDNYEAKFWANNSRQKIHRGLAIEPQLNASKSMILDKNEKYSHFIIYRFDKK